MLNFYFFHIGNDPILPDMMISSIRNTNTKSKVFQITDRFSTKLENVDDCFRFDGYTKNIMKFRMEAYSKVPLLDKSSALFLDTDMLVLKEIEEQDLFKNAEVVFCKREINFNALVNINYNNMNMTEYRNMTLGEAWPFLGCFIGVKDSKPFVEMNYMYNDLERKYKTWYGDQIVLKKYAENNLKKIRTVGEKDYAFVPYRNIISKNTKIAHFKGKDLKKFMKTCYEHFFS